MGTSHDLLTGRGPLYISAEDGAAFDLPGDKRKKAMAFEIQPGDSFLMINEAAASGRNGEGVSFVGGTLDVTGEQRGTWFKPPRDQDDGTRPEIHDMLIGGSMSDPTYTPASSGVAAKLVYGASDYSCDSRAAQVQRFQETCKEYHYQRHDISGVRGNLKIRFDEEGMKVMWDGAKAQDYVQTDVGPKVYQVLVEEVQDSDTYGFDVDGNTIAYTTPASGNTIESIRDALVLAVNQDATVGALVIAKGLAGGIVEIVGRDLTDYVVDTEVGSVLITMTRDVLELPYTPQSNRVTVTALNNSTAYGFTINATAISFTSDADATLAEIAEGLVAAVNAEAAVNTVVQAVLIDTAAGIFDIFGLTSAAFTVTSIVSDLSVVETTGVIPGGRLPKNQIIPYLNWAFTLSTVGAEPITYGSPSMTFIEFDFSIEVTEQKGPRGGRGISEIDTTIGMPIKVMMQLKHRSGEQNWIQIAQQNQFLKLSAEITNVRDANNTLILGDRNGGIFLQINATPAKSASGNFEFVDIEAYTVYPEAVPGDLRPGEVYAQMFDLTFTGDALP